MNPPVFPRPTVLALAALAVVALVGATRFASRPSPAVSSRGNPAPRSASEASPVDALDHSVQERFRTLTSFGMSRMPLVPQHVYQFDPETPEEKAAVADLRNQGLSVGLYLGGLGLLGSPMSEADWKKGGEYDLRRAISDPIVVSGAATPEGLPKPWELQEIGRRALEASAAGDRYEASFGRWSVDVRPVRASQSACLECHKAGGTAAERESGAGTRPDLKVGDALGVAVYLYAREPG